MTRLACCVDPATARTLHNVAKKARKLSQIRLAPLTAADVPEVEALLDAAFGTDRHARTAYRLREGMALIPALSLVARDEASRLLGSLQSWPVELRTQGGAVPLILLGPVAVDPTLQRGGIGKLLMAEALRAADAMHAEPMMLIGDEEYYGRFGFHPAATQQWTLPGPFERHRLLARLGEGVTLPEHGDIGPRLMAGRKAG